MTTSAARASIKLGSKMTARKPAAPRLTFATVRKELAAIGITVKANDWNEYVVKVAGERDDSGHFIDRGHTRETQIEALEEALTEGRAMAARVERAAASAVAPRMAATVAPVEPAPGESIAVYRLGSAPMCSAPGVVAWAINGYHFPKDRKKLESIICDTWGLPAAACRALLSKEVPYTLEGETVVFSVRA